MQTFASILAGVAIGFLFAGFFGMQGVLDFQLMIIVGAGIQAVLLVGMGYALQTSGKI